MFQTSLYKSTPIWLQSLAIDTRAFARNVLREGPPFRRYLREVDATERLNSKALRAYQFNHMLDMVLHACKYTSYYSELFKQNDLSIADFKTLEDFSSIPLLTKNDILKNVDGLLASNSKGRRIKGSTSGTTGTPITIYQDLEAINRENAFIWRQLHWAGYKKGQRRAWIRGDMIVPIEQTDEPFWRYNVTDNMLMMSSYHLCEQTIKRYLQELEEFDPVVIQAYPSSVGLLAAYLESHNQYYKGESLAAIVTSSETLTNRRREQIERHFGSSVYDWYGNFERVSAIGTCEHKNYHVISDYSYTELVPIGDGSAQIIGSGFNNRVMPLLRYKTNDVVTLADEGYECPCGRSFPLVKSIEGRMDDYVKTPDGKMIGRLDHIYKGLKNIAEAQIVQERLDEVRILVVPFDGFSKSEESRLLSNARCRLGQNIAIKVERVASIPRTRTGKFRGVVCNLKE